MKELHYETVTIEKETSYTHTCNSCGKNIKVRPCTTDEWDDDIKDFYADFGYGSEFDGEQWSFSLCEECLLKLIKQFKYVPDGFKLDNYSNLTQEQHQELFEDWKKTGEWEELKFKTYEELIDQSKICGTEYINEIIKKFHSDKPLL